MNGYVQEEETTDGTRGYTVRGFFHSRGIFEEHTFSLTNEMELKNLSVRIVQEYT